MKAEDIAGFLAALKKVQDDLGKLARSSEAEIEAASQAFKSLAGQSGAILERAAAIVACVEKEGMGDVLPSVQSLCLTVSGFLEQKLEAATSIMRSLKEEEDLLKQLTRVTQRQGAISSHLEALSVLTDVEVAQLGRAGGDFLILARELSAFSQSISNQTLELASHTESRNLAIEESRRELAATVPRLRGELTQMEAGIGENLHVIDAGLEKLARIPGQFNACAQQTSLQIAGVVAAIQAHDITRQQIEHVQTGLELVASRLAGPSGASDDELPLAYAGLLIQASQIKNIMQTVDNWTSQIGSCMSAIRELSVSELVHIGPDVLQQERELTSHLALIDSLQQKSQEYTGRIEKTLEGLTSLLGLIQEHLERSRNIRHRLQLLTFNSLIEAHRLGSRGAVVSAIAKMIKEVSAEWNAIADQSKLTLTEIMKHVKHTNEVMEVFSEARGQKLRDERARTNAALENVRTAAAFVASESESMQIVMEEMQADLATACDTEDRLQACFDPLSLELAQIESLTRRMEAHDSRIAERYDAAEVERLFSASYTTEIERQVLHAALHGSEMPVLQQSLTGNDVELF